MASSKDYLDFILEQDKVLNEIAIEENKKNGEI